MPKGYDPSVQSRHMPALLGMPTAQPDPTSRFSLANAPMPVRTVVELRQHREHTMTGGRGPVPCTRPVTPRPGDRVRVGSAGNRSRVTGLGPIGSPGLPRAIPDYEEPPKGLQAQGYHTLRTEAGRLASDCSERLPMVSKCSLHTCAPRVLGADMPWPAVKSDRLAS